MKPSPRSVSARRGARDDRVGDLVARVEQRAELVAAHPERAAAAGQVGREVAAEADEQRVARRVAEGVVVVLEAVEVEEHEHERAGVVGLGQQLARGRAPARGGCRARSARRSSPRRARSRRIVTFSRKVSISRAITATSASADSADRERVEVAPGSRR